MSDVKPKGGKRENAGRKSTKEGSGASVYVPSELLPIVREMIDSYKLSKGTNS